MPADTRRSHTQEIFCTACKQIKGLEAFDGNQFTKRFGGNKMPDGETKKVVPQSYNPEKEKKKSMRQCHSLKKMWCRSCVPPLKNEFYCSECEENIPRVKFAQAQLSKHVSDEDRLCRDCANLTTQKVEAIRLGEEYDADEIENKLTERKAKETDKE